jgi:uncharacterized damage-inducible protein DinB
MIQSISGDPALVFTLGGVRTLHRWTHASLALLLNHLSTIPELDYARALPAFGFPTLREQVIHIFNCERFWISALQGLEYIDRTPVQCPTIANATYFQEEVALATRTYLAELTDQELNTATKLHFSDGDVAVQTPALILYHVLTHAFHHKGQAVAMCRALGHPAPDTDLNQFE